MKLDDPTWSTFHSVQSKQQALTTHAVASLTLKQLEGDSRQLRCLFILIE